MKRPLIYPAGTKWMTSESSPRPPGVGNHDPVSERPPLGLLKVMWLDVKWRISALAGGHPNVPVSKKMIWHIWDLPVEVRARASNFRVVGNT